MTDTTTTRATPTPIGVAVVGFGWMGRAHTQAYARVAQHFPDLSVRPRLVAVVDELGARGADAAALHGFERSTTDWRTLLDDPAVQAVSITTPNAAHRAVGAAFAAAGKHVWIEKPVGVSLDDAEHVAAAIAAAGVQSTVGFNYRTAPAIEEAARLVADGTIGAVTHASVRMPGDYAADAAGAFTWRYERANAGAGVIGDLGSHAIDLVRMLLGEVDEVVADGAIFVPQRRRPHGTTAGHERVETGELVDVENEDWSSAILRMASGARVTLETSRVAAGHQNDYGVRIHGTHGVLDWDFRRMGELRVAHGAEAQDLAVATRFVGPEAGRFRAFQPGAGIAMGYDDLKVLEAEGFLRSIATGTPHGATIADAVAAARIADAISRSIASRGWERVAA